jgi:hypothetical protein
MSSDVKSKSTDTTDESLEGKSSEVREEKKSKFREENEKTGFDQKNANMEMEVLTLPDPGAHEFTPTFSGVLVARSLVFCVVFCKLLFVLLSFFSFGHNKRHITRNTQSQCSFLIG